MVFQKQSAQKIGRNIWSVQILFFWRDASSKEARTLNFLDSPPTPFGLYVQKTEEISTFPCDPKNFEETIFGTFNASWRIWSHGIATPNSASKFAFGPSKSSCQHCLTFSSHANIWWKIGNFGLSKQSLDLVLPAARELRSNFVQLLGNINTHNTFVLGMATEAI